MRASTLRRIRPWVQLVTFLLFLFLLIRAGQTGFLATDLFYRLDPLVGLASMIAARQIVAALLIGTLIALIGRSCSDAPGAGGSARSAPCWTGRPPTSRSSTKLTRGRGCAKSSISSCC